MTCEFFVNISVGEKLFGLYVSFIDLVIGVIYAILVNNDTDVSNVTNATIVANVVSVFFPISNVSTAC